MMASAIQNMQTIRAIVRPEGKHACCMAPDNVQRSVEYSTITLKTIACRGHKKRKKPNMAEKPSVVSPLI